jgi:hypothetical protein
MARELVFLLDGKPHSAAPTKIERKKLYGWTEVLALDDDNNECKLVSMDESGTVIIPKGGIGLGILTDDMTWVDRSELMAVTMDGAPAEVVPSSFDAPIANLTPATPEQLLDTTVTAFYQLDSASPELLEAARSSILTFDYAYREGFEASPAFLLENDGTLFMLVGYKSAFDMIGLQETALVDDPESTGDEGEDDSDDIDFSML